MELNLSTETQYDIEFSVVYNCRFGSSINEIRRLQTLSYRRKGVQFKMNTKSGTIFVRCPDCQKIDYRKDSSGHTFHVDENGVGASYCSFLDIGMDDTLSYAELLERLFNPERLHIRKIANL